MCGGSKDTECFPQNLLFSNTAAWRLYSPENVNSKSVRVFYLVWRWLWTILFTTFLVLSGALPQTWYADQSQRIKYFIYLTNWGYLTFCIAQIWNAATSTAGYFTQDKEVRWYMKINWFLYSFTSSPAVLISLLFWALIYSSSYPLEPDTFFTHGINCLFTLLDIWLTAMPIKILHFYIPASFAVVYVVFSVIYDYSNGTNALLRPYIYSVNSN
ncbi:hypothetical protein EB796_019121 [Bugula neritina]|uniref:Uncharacterized protein n=1 Tax=Bugula neritina TaxID=10212 RepID=A0A7J7J8M5_BUGNE|nr:hypothetical protein EB796_019121 [Bugula neritina]